MDTTREYSDIINVISLSLLSYFLGTLHFSQILEVEM
jgi:hypothetical protein